MKKYILFIILSISGWQYCYPNNAVEISLFTCSAGEESYSAWGHSAIRVIDQNNSTDIVYNFGLFDFDTPHFNLKFINGRLKYKLGIHSTSGFLDSYISENRQVVEQKLNLSDESKIKIIKELDYLYRPENRYYYYSFLSKNCTTELRDLLFNNTDTDFQNEKIIRTPRNQINEYVKDEPWLKFGINLIFGTRVDRELKTYESMFLPDYLCAELKTLKINNEDFVLSENTYNETETGRSDLTLLSPFVLFSIVLILAIIFKSTKLQYSVLLIIGLAGLLLLAISILTEHPELKNNFNLLWCNPLYLISAVLQFKDKVRLQKYLSIVLQVLIFGMIIIWFAKFQSPEIAFIPCVLTLSLYNIRVIMRVKG